MAKYGLKGSHAQCILALFVSDGGLSARELCEACDKDKAAISRTVAELELAGYINKLLDGDNVYRAKHILSKKGEALAKEIQQKAIAAVKKADMGISEQELLAFYNTLDAFAKNLDKISREEL